MAHDGDLGWLLGHLPPAGTPNLHRERAQRAQQLMDDLVAAERLPYTIGLFGTWGSGKTTFLSVLAERLLAPAAAPRYALVYFNAWKYAGFMEIVPSLIYKILQEGGRGERDTKEIIARIMISLGREHTDQMGRWISDHLGLDPIKLFHDLRKLKRAVQEGEALPAEVLDEYYGQVDRAQDLLQDVFEGAEKTTVVLIDELDRCDPDEAFAVIKQLRVFFSMRNVPLLFVLCANPEPIGLAIKHRYGLDTPTGDYEARRILEKFVDTYIDLSEPLRLEAVVRSLWQEQGLEIEKAAFVLGADEHVRAERHQDTVLNATALESMNLGNPLYANLRLLHKSLGYVARRQFSNRHLLWTAWHLEMAEQLDGSFRREVARLSGDLRLTARDAHTELLRTHYHWEGQGAERRLVIDSDKGGTVFGVFRSCYWEAARRRIEILEKQREPEAVEARRIFARWMADYQRLDYLAMLSLLPLRGAPAQLPEHGPEGGRFEPLGEFLTDSLLGQFGWLLANY